MLQSCSGCHEIEVAISIREMGSLRNQNGAVNHVEIDENACEIPKWSINSS